MLTTIFLFSLFSIVIIISLKAVEERRQKRFLFPRLRNRADVLTKKIANETNQVIYSINANNGKSFISLFRKIILNTLYGISRKIKLRKLKFTDSLRVRGNLNKKGSASFFLKNVSEYKGKYIK